VCWQRVYGGKSDGRVMAQHPPTMNQPGQIPEPGMTAKVLPAIPVTLAVLTMETRASLMLSKFCQSSSFQPQCFAGHRIPSCSIKGWGTSAGLLSYVARLVCHHFIKQETPFSAWLAVALFSRVPAMLCIPTCCFPFSG
jgi:hypothetical protein